MKEARVRGPFAGLTVAQLGEDLRSVQRSVPELTAMALDAAETSGPTLGAFVTVDREGAEAAAEVLQRELDRGFDRGPLHGLPIGIKDMIDTAGVSTTYGSRHFAEHVPLRDAQVVQDVKQAGCVVIGKTTTHEFAYGSTGDRGVGTPTRNPHNPSLMSGGSSAGSGAAIGAGILPLALGTDTGGSVRIPVALCGGYGLRPTSGSVDSAGVFGLSKSLDTVGPMASDLVGVRYLWETIHNDAPAGPRLHRASPARSEHEPQDRFELAVAECGLTAAVADSVQRAFDSALAKLSTAGWQLQPVQTPQIDAAWEHYSEVQGPEAYAVHAQRVDSAPGLFEPEVLERLRAATNVSGWRYVHAVEARPEFSEQLSTLMGNAHALVLPTVPIEAPEVNAREGDFGGGWTHPRPALLSLTGPFSYLGWPALALQLDRPSGLPSSLQLVARPGEEDLLFAIALEIERMLHGTSLHH